MTPPSVTRRDLLAAAGTGLAGGVAGCTGGPEHGCGLDDPPDRVADLSRPVLGDPDADITVAVYEDFGCPHCADFKLEEFPELRAEFIDPGEIRYEHWDFPIEVTDWSVPVANAARGIQDRLGTEAFFEFATRAFERQADHSFEVIGEIAEAVGGERCAAIRDAEFGTYQPVLDADYEAGRDRGVQATPTAMVNGEVVVATAPHIRREIRNRRE